MPKSVVRKLGLEEKGKVGVRYADGRRAIRRVVDNVYVHLLDRSSVFKAVVEARRESALIGAFVLEDLDLMVDPTRERLLPRDPRYMISYAE